MFFRASGSFEPEVLVTFAEGSRLADTGAQNVHSKQAASLGSIVEPLLASQCWNEVTERRQLTHNFWQRLVHYYVEGCLKHWNEIVSWTLIGKSSQPCNLENQTMTFCVRFQSL